jgi:hypothetical protein
MLKLYISDGIFTQNMIVTAEKKGVNSRVPPGFKVSLRMKV